MFAALLDTDDFRFPALPGGGDDEAVSGTATVTLTVANDGTWTVAGVNAGIIATGKWIDPTAFAPGPYHVRMDATSGSFSSGSATGSDLALTSTRSWTLNRESVGEAQVSYTLSIKTASGGTVVSTINGSMTARALT